MNLQNARCAAASTLLSLYALAATAVPGPPIGCAGQPGVGGCAPYIDVYIADGAGTTHLFEYELAQIDIARSQPLSDGRGTANLFARGHRIRLDISSSNFPRFDLNPNTGDPLQQHRRMLPADHSVYHQAVQASHALLPIIPRE